MIYDKLLLSRGFEIETIAIVLVQSSTPSIQLEKLFEHLKQYNVWLVKAYISLTEQILYLKHNLKNTYQ